MINKEAAIEINRRHIQTLTRELTPLIPLFEDKNLTNIYVYGNGKVKADDFIKGNYDTGLVIEEEARFRIINCLSSMSDTPIDPWANPTLESIIPDYHIRTTAILPPWVSSPELTFRRPASDIFPLEKYVGEKRMTETQYDTLVSHIRNRSNILIGGGTGSGKTTFTNACIEKMREFTPLERFYIIEDTPEILCECENKTQVYIRKEQASQAIQTALRWCPKRIIFGELRSGVVAVELLEAWNTGHPGNITTLHADSAESMIRRLEGMLREVIQGKLPDLSFTIQLCVHLSYKPGFGPLVDEVTTVKDILEKSKNRESGYV